MSSSARSNSTLDGLLRGDFPILDRTVGGRGLIYLDTAATALKPKEVIDSEVGYLTNYTSNIKRGNHQLSDESEEAYEAARSKIARFINATPTQVVFTSGTTASLNMVASGLALSRSNSKVLLPTSEHHSNIVPWMNNAQVVWAEQAGSESVEVKDVCALLDRESPDVLAFSYASNVTGSVNAVNELCLAASVRNVITCVDASQIMLHRRIDFRELGCDFLVFSGHKMLASTGIGVLVGKPDRLRLLKPLLYGGGGVERVGRDGFTLKDIPDRLEAGTPNIAGAIGLGAAVDYLSRINPEDIVQHDRVITAHIRRGLESTNGWIGLMGSGYDNLPLASLAPSTQTMSSGEWARMLSDFFGIMVRSGFHCAHPLFEGFSLPGGALRISAGPYTSTVDIDSFFDAMMKIRRRL